MSESDLKCTFAVVFHNIKIHIKDNYMYVTSLKSTSYL